MHLNPLLKIVFAIMIVAAIASLAEESDGRLLLDFLWSN